MTHQDPEPTSHPHTPDPARHADAGDVDEAAEAIADGTGSDPQPFGGAREADDEAGEADGGADPDDAVSEVDELAEATEEDPLAAAQRERDEYLDALRRKQAEFENFRKRMMREGASQRITGHAEVAERMLDVLDDFDRTLAAAGEVDPGFLKGVELVHDKLAQVLADFGLARIDQAGVAFDPNRHEAVQQVEAQEDRDEPVVSQVLRPGYELGDRVLRAAMVAVEQ